MSSYFIAQIKIHNREEYKKYLEGTNEILKKYKGEVLVVDDTPIVLEGEWPYTRVVIIRFADEEEVKRWYNSTEYQALAQHRFKASKANTILAKGCN